MKARHKRTKGVYEIISMDARIKDPTTRGWLKAVAYMEEGKGGPIYCRNHSDFMLNFEMIDGESKERLPKSPRG